MKKTHKINISDLKEFNVKEAFEYFETYDFEKLKYTSDTNNKELINNTLSIRNVNKYNIKGFIFYKTNSIQNVVGYIENVKLIKNDLIFDLIYLKTIFGLKFFNKKNICFDIMFSNSILELNTSGSYVYGATLKTDSKSLRIVSFLISNKKTNTLKIF
jgi:hypothetical protein